MINMAKTIKTTKKRVKKPAAAKMLETPVEQNETVNTAISEPAPAEDSAALAALQDFSKTALLESEIEALKKDLDETIAENEKLKKENEQLKTDIVTTKENAKKLNTLFESYEIEFLKMENEELRKQIAKLKNNNNKFIDTPASDTPASNIPASNLMTNKNNAEKYSAKVINRSRTILAPTNGYEYW